MSGFFSYLWMAWLLQIYPLVFGSYFTRRLTLKISRRQMPVGVLYNVDDSMMKAPSPSAAQFGLLLLS
jgi:hypothetical protein